MSNYYNENAKLFIDDTLNVDMTEQYRLFEKYLPKTGKLLDIGFGSGRDSLYFSHNYEVVSIDNSEAFVEEGKKLLNNEVLLLDIKDMHYKEDFDGIWACASLLHIPYVDLPFVLYNCYHALKDHGVMYLSFKHGEFEGIRNGRYFTDLTEDKLKDLLAFTPFKLQEIRMSKDVRPGIEREWINIIVEK